MMGFLSFNEKYYASALADLEGKSLNPDQLDRVRQLLKLLDDLADEDYPQLGRDLEQKFRAMSRLHAILDDYGQSPFPVGGASLPTVRRGGRMGIDGLCRRLTRRAREATPSDDPFLSDLEEFCRWIGDPPDTAYVFLLRDAFLPYLFFQSRGREKLYPWVIGRDYLRRISGAPEMDDLLRRTIYDTLEEGITDFAPFFDRCKARIRAVLRDFPALENALGDLLSGISAKRILVIESGCTGTVPLTLCALDGRADFRMYSAAPYLYPTYGDRLYCRRYEQIRRFETLSSSDLLMEYAAVRAGRFYVRTARADWVWNLAAAEASRLLPKEENS